MLAQKTDSTVVFDALFCLQLRCRSCEFRGSSVLNILSTCIKINGFIFNFCMVDNKEMVADAAFEQVEFSQREGCRPSPLRKYMPRVRRAKTAWGADVS